MSVDATVGGLWLGLKSNVLMELVCENGLVSGLASAMGYGMHEPGSSMTENM
jgi:hypothetical protein